MSEPATSPLERALAANLAQTARAREHGERVDSARREVIAQLGASTHLTPAQLIGDPAAASAHISRTMARGRLLRLG